MGIELRYIQKKKGDLWRKESGIDGAGMAFLMCRGKEWYARHKQHRTIETGDRVAILGCGIGVVEQANDTHVLVLLWNRTLLRISRKEIVWDKPNMRWEAMQPRSEATAWKLNGIKAGHKG